MENYFELFYKSKQCFSIDSRNIEPGYLYIAIIGANFNGNDYIQSALDNGASYCITSVEKFADGKKVFYVDDTLKFLQKLANHHRNKFEIPFIGITGSNGKTTTKELIVSVLKTKFNVLSTEGNLNNHIGVPLTLLRLNKSHDIAVIEMGANKPGDIEELCDIAEPNYGIITNIGLAHLEGFGGYEGVKRTKLAMYRAMIRKNGKIFYNLDDETLATSIPNNIKTNTYSINKSSELIGQILDSNPFLHFTYTNGGENSFEVKSKLIGNYNLYNFLCAICIGQYFGVENEKIIYGLEAYTPNNNRSQWQKTKRNTLIIDCYNANLTSMKAAILSLSSFKGKKMAIIGDMLELGDESNHAHHEILALCLSHEISVICVGNEFYKQSQITEKYLNTEALIESKSLKEIGEYTILIKGSRGIGLEKIIPYL